MTDPDAPSDQQQLTHNQVNLARALREVRRRGVAIGEHIRDVTGLGVSRTNVLVHALGDAGLVALGGQPRVSKQEAITLRGKAGCVVGVDMTLDQVTVAVGNLEYELLNDPSRATRQVPIDDWKGTLDVIAESVVTQLQLMQTPHDLMGVGLGLPGPVQRGTGSPESDHLLSGWKGVPVAAELRQRLIAAGLPDARVVVGNDASCGALGVLTRAIWANPAEAPEDLVYVRVTHGVGMGLVIKGHLVTGADGFAGEIGHVRVDAYGPICTRCGRRGCLEVMASEKVVIDILRGHNWHESRKGPNVAAEVAAAKDARTRDEVGKAGWWVGFAFAGVANVLNPAWIVLGGTLTELPAFREHFEEALRAYSLPQAFERLRVSSWDTIFDEQFSNDRPRDVGRNLTPELLGAMAFVIDEFGDEFLRPKVLGVTM
jgi:predicted NBD/HSP70 family sugar kinase